MGPQSPRHALWSQVCILDDLGIPNHVFGSHFEMFERRQLPGALRMYTPFSMCTPHTQGSNPVTALATCATACCCTGSAAGGCGPAAHPGRNSGRGRDIQDNRLTAAALGGWLPARAASWQSARTGRQPRMTSTCASGKSWAASLPPLPRGIFQRGQPRAPSGHAALLHLV